MVIYLDDVNDEETYEDEDEGSTFESLKNEHSGLLGVAAVYRKRIRGMKRKKTIFCSRLQ